MKKVRFINLKYWLSEVFQMVVAILPLIICLIINWDKYYQFKTENKVSTTFGFIMVIVMLVLCLIRQSGILRHNFLLVFMWLLTATIYCLRFIIVDLVSIMFCATLGLTLGTIIKNTLVAYYRRLRDKKETSDINSYGMEQVLKNVFKDSGRV